MKAMILAAGLGTRLRPLTETQPKPLLPVAGTPLIVWNLLLLRRHGVTEVLINLHHLGPMIEQTLGDGRRYGLTLTYSHEPAILGTGGGIKQAEPFFEGHPFLVLNGDTLLELDLGALMQAHRERGALATMVLREDPDVERWGPVTVDQAGRILSITGRGRTGSGAAQRLMFAGVHVMHPRLLREVPAGRESSIIDAYVRAITEGEPVYGYRMAGYWSDVGTPERYAQAQRDAEAGLIALAGRVR
ncbi:MAG: nucleotidyltransferase family protein [Nitrospirota bacterium]|nr:nucleotidyltransferase family protein [Nitrospirota bacterium]